MLFYVILCFLVYFNLEDHLWVMSKITLQPTQPRLREILLSGRHCPSCLESLYTFPLLYHMTVSSKHADNPSMQ